MTEHLESDLAARDAVDRFARSLRETRARMPGRSVHLRDLGDVRLRRQIVRWMGREYHEVTPGIVEALRSALGDDDWEVRMSAILVGARLRAQALRSAMRDASIPSPKQHGLSERDVRLLVAARIVAVEALGSANADDVNRAQVILRQLSDVPRHLVRSVLGLPIDQRDGAWLLLHALSTPYELADPLPELPAGLTMRDGRISLADAIEMCWVSPQPHVLGGDHTNGAHAGGSAPVREHTPGRGFFVARFPLSAATAHQVGLATSPARAHADSEVAARLAQTADAPLAVTYDEAVALCRDLSERARSIVSLPTADELECAARGTDGRRFPWGNGLERLEGRERSPHGIERFATPVAQWTITRDPDDVPLVLGGPASPHCAGRAPSFGFNAVRPVVRIEGGRES
jgi:hypothetical protein